MTLSWRRDHAGQLRGQGVTDRATQANVLYSSDAELAVRLRDGDESALVHLVDTHFERVVTFVAYMLGSYDAAQDVAQDVFVRLWERRDTLDPARGIAAFLFTLARNAALNDIKYRQVRKRYQDRLRAEASLLPDAGSVPSREEEILSVATVQLALRQLSDRRELAVRLRVEEQLGYDEIAQVLEVSPAAAERLVQRGLEELRKILRSYGVAG